MALATVDCQLSQRARTLCQIILLAEWDGKRTWRGIIQVRVGPNMKPDATTHGQGSSEVANAEAVGFRPSTCILRSNFVPTIEARARVASRHLRWRLEPTQFISRALDDGVDHRRRLSLMSATTMIDAHI